MNYPIGSVSLALVSYKVKFSETLILLIFQNISGILDKITDHVQELRDTVSENVIATAKSSIDDLRKNLPDLIEVGKDISSIQVQCSRSVPRSILSAEESISVAAHIPVSTSNSHIAHESN